MSLIIFWLDSVSPERTSLESDPGHSGPVSLMSTSCDSCPTCSFITSASQTRSLQSVWFLFIFCRLFFSLLLLQMTVRLWPVKPVVWSSPTISNGSRSGRRCPIRRVSCTRPSEWPTCCSTSRRWNVLKVTASRRSTRWETSHAHIFMFLTPSKTVS